MKQSKEMEEIGVYNKFGQNKDKIMEELENMILTFKPRTVLQTAQPGKDIPEIDNGILTGESIRRIKQFINDNFIFKSKETPMGVSQWKEHGKKYGYDKYFHKDCISKEDIRKLRHAFELDDAELVTKRLIIDALNNLLSKNKE